MRASVSYSHPEIHYDQAIVAYRTTIDLIENDLPKHNEFYVFLVHRFMQLISDATNAMKVRQINEKIDSSGERENTSVLS